MMITSATYHEEVNRAADIAVLPIGSFEQHGSHLPLATDTLIAAIIARRIATDYDLFLLPPLSFSCSHEHSGFMGTVSISSVTLHAIVGDITASLERHGVHRLVVINGHGGNYVLGNIVQEANVSARRLVLYPQSKDWAEARTYAGVRTDSHEDMHAGEAETSILLHEAPDVVHPSYREADFTADDRRHLLTVGIKNYSQSGVIGRPSWASRDKGRRLVEAFSLQFEPYLAQLRRTPGGSCQEG